MKSITFILVFFILALQWPMWFGKGSWVRVMQIESQLADQRKTNEALLTRNRGLTAEVHDLKQGQEAIEERARSELGMIRAGETFFQILLPQS